jgi:SAM-dependent methyltransferase
VEDGALLVGFLDPAGRCSACHIAWPALAVDGDSIPLLLPDPYGNDEALAATSAILAGLADPSGLLAAEGGDTLRPWLDPLLTWAGAHFGLYAMPPLPTPTLDWVGAWLGALSDLPDGPILLLGAAAGGEILALPPSDRHVVALEANPVLLAWTSAVAQGCELLPCRRTASQLEARPLALSDDRRRRLAEATLLCADALDPPFEVGSFAVILCLNLVDSVSDPEVLLNQCQALLRPGGALLLASPWHWVDSITPPRRRLDRSFDPQVSHAWQMSSLLTGALVPEFMHKLRLQHSEDARPWSIRVHDRMTVHYSLQALLLRRIE